VAEAKAKEARNMEGLVTSPDSGPRLRARSNELRLLSEADVILGAKSPYRSKWPVLAKKKRTLALA
jgi:hypothetical protein